MSRQKTVAPNPDIWARIEFKQAELHALYEEAAVGIYKGTEGEAFLGEKNVAFAQYWMNAVKKTPTVVTGEFNLPDFEIKEGLFPLFVKVYNAHNAAGAVLSEPYDILAKDVLRYSSDAKKSFDISSDPVRKQVVKDAPAYRKPPVKKDGGSDPTNPSDAAPK
jgi:hypothetical protein